VDRRRFLQVSAGALAMATARSLYARQALAPTTLREAGAARGIFVGAAIGRGQLVDPAMAQLVADQFSILVCENDMKWAATHPEQDRYDFTHADEVVAFAESHDQFMRGHNLCWHADNPKWLEAVLSPKNAAAILEDHVRTVAGHYAGRIQSWDVVNEAVRPDDERRDGLRKSVWFQMLGPDYI
jgi:endo-1,4-beta-xylanase